MRVSLPITFLAFIPASLAAGGLVRRQNSCASVTNNCPNNGKAYRYCSDYLDIRPQRTTTRYTVSTVTIETQFTASTVTTSQCPTHGPANKKRTIGNAFEERHPEPTAFVINDDLAPVIGRRQAAPPSCLSKYTRSSQLSSACSCYDYPITSSTRTVRRTTTLQGAPTTTRYTETVTLTTREPAPTCNVVSTKNGKKTTWREFYGLCFGFRADAYYPNEDHVYPADVPLCEALNRCANDVKDEGAGSVRSVRTFELTFVDFSQDGPGPKWYCTGYGSNVTDNPEYYIPAEDWYETYGYGF